MYCIHCRCQCRNPYYIQSSMYNYNRSAFQSALQYNYDEQPPHCSVPRHNYDDQSANWLPQRNSHDEQLAYWSSPSVTEYAKQFDSWAR